MVWLDTGSGLPKGMTPSIIRANGDGSFFTLPVRILDYEHHVNPGPANGIHFKFTTDANKLLQKNGDSSETEVPDQDQWLTNVLPTPFYSVNRTTLEGDGVPDLAFPDEGVWRACGPTITFGMEKPSAGTSVHITFRVNLALSSDLTTILGSALLTLRYTRP